MTYLSSSPRAPAELQRIAYHEAGHAAMAHYLGGRISVVSIQSTKHWAGVAFHSGRTFTNRDMDRLDCLAPLFDWPPRIRRNLESGIVISYAGPLAEDLQPSEPPPLESGYGPPTSAEVVLREVDRLTHHERDLLAQGDNDDHASWSDAQSAYDAALLLDPDTPGLLCDYWCGVTARLLRESHRLRRYVHALADALIEHTDLSGEAATAILDGVDDTLKKARQPDAQIDPQVAAASA